MTSSIATVQAIAAFSPNKAVPAPKQRTDSGFLHAKFTNIKFYLRHIQQHSKGEAKVLVVRDILVKVLQIFWHALSLGPTFPKKRQIQMVIGCNQKKYR